jgi:dihydroxyacetone kinase-like predicted kinase
MMTSDRLSQLEKNLKRLREQLHGKEDTLITIAPEERIRIQQQIADVRDQIKPFEEEYWQVLSQYSDHADFTDAEAIIVEIGDQSDKLQSQELSEEILAWVRKIHEKVSQSEPSAAAKLKGVISSIPPFVGISYEAELDTENFLRTNFPTFRKWVESLTKK